jgi:cellobiose dehydrogenase (acceptor)
MGNVSIENTVEMSVSETYVVREYLQPLPFAGPTITPISFTKDEDNWNLIYRCQNCTTWPGGGMVLDDFTVLSWVFGEDNKILHFSRIY